MTLSLLSALILAVVHVCAVGLRSLNRIPRSRWLSAAGGIAVAYVFVHLLPELARGQQVIERSEIGWLGALELHAYLIALVGLLLFYGLERMIKVHRSQLNDPDAAHPGVFWLHIGSFAFYNSLIGYVLAERSDFRPSSLAWYTAAMALHFLVNDFGLQNAHPRLFGHKGRWILAAAPLVGWGLGMLSDVSELTLSALTAFIAGGVVLNVLKEELPEERESRFGAFLLGSMGYALLLAATGEA